MSCRRKSFSSGLGEHKRWIRSHLKTVSSHLQNCIVSSSSRSRQDQVSDADSLTARKNLNNQKRNNLTSSGNFLITTRFFGGVATYKIVSSEPGAISDYCFGEPNRSGNNSQSAAPEHRDFFVSGEGRFLLATQNHHNTN